MSGTLDVTLPLHTVSEANARSHHHERARRAAAQRSGVVVALRPLLRKAGVTAYVEHWEGGFIRSIEAPAIVGPVVVLMTRLSRGELDDDNLRGALKSVRDGIADALGLKSDRDPRVRWDYAQGRGTKARPYGVRIEVRPREIEVERPRGGTDG